MTSNFSAFLEVPIFSGQRPFIARGQKTPRSLILHKTMPWKIFLKVTPDFQIFSKLKNWKFLNCDFCPTKCSKWPNLDPGWIKNRFWAEKKIFKFFNFWTQKNFKILSLLVKFSKFCLKFLKKAKFFPSFFLTGFELILHGLPTGLYITCLLWLDQKIIQTKIPHFFDFFDNFSQISSFWVIFSYTYS